MATRPALTAEEVLESVLNDSDLDSDSEYFEPDYDFDVPMADGSDDEFSDLEEQEECTCNERVTSFQQYGTTLLSRTIFNTILSTRQQHSCVSTNYKIQ